MSKKKTKTTPKTTTNDRPSVIPTILIGDHPDLGRVVKPVYAGTFPPIGVLMCDGRPGPHFVAERIIAVAGSIAVVQGRFDATLGDYCARLIAHDEDEPINNPWMPQQVPVDPWGILDQYVAFISKESIR